MGRPRIVLAGRSPSLQGLQWESDDALRIGRHESSDIVLQDNSVGRQHAEVAFRRSRWVLRDLARNDRTPTLVNGRPVGPGEWPLHFEDLLHFGNMALEVTALEEPESEKPPSSTGVGAAGSCLKSSGTFMRIEAAAKNSWEGALQVMTQKRDASPNQRDHLFTLLRAGQHLTHIGSLD